MYVRRKSHRVRVLLQESFGPLPAVLTIGITTLEKRAGVLEDFPVESYICYKYVHTNKS
jgi:hypothetical protein